MQFVTDASSLINLYNADSLDAICELDGKGIVVTPLVIRECNANCGLKLIELGNSNSIQFVDDEDIPTEPFMHFLDQHRLGLGESESIVTAKHLDCFLCCDDRRARSVAVELLGAERVVGSLRFLRWAVESDILDCTSAFARYEVMKNSGGYLPAIDEGFFCQNLPFC